jgi:hypothetical protein
MMNSDIDVDIEEKHLPFAMVGFSSRKAPAKKSCIFKNIFGCIYLTLVFK